MPGGTNIRNERGLRRVQAATETTSGVAATPDYRWYGDLAISQNAPLVRTFENTGTYDALINPAREVPTFSGTYSERLTYQSLAMHNQYAIKGGATGVAAGTGYSYVRSPSGTDDDIDSATLEYGFDGMVWRSTGVRHNEYTITIDTDDTDNVWKLSSDLFVRDKTQVIGFSGTATGGTATTITQTSAGWTTNQWAGAWVFLNFNSPATTQVRQITSNTADTLTIYGPNFSPTPGAGNKFRIEGLFTAGIPFTNYTPIRVQGTKFYLDQATGTIGTTQVLDRVVSFNVTVANARTTKRFAENVGVYSARTGRGKRMITGQMRMEFDRREEYQQYLDNTEMAIRVQQTGGIIGAGPQVYTAQIDLPRVVWDVIDEDEREENITATFGFVAYVPTSGNILTMTSINNLATLP